MLDADQNARAKQIIESLFGLGVESDNRLPRLIEAVVWEQADVFWRVFADTWASCDNTAKHRDDLIQILEDQGMQGDWQAALQTDDAEWFKSLPDRLKVYRGCDPPPPFGMVHLGVCLVATRSI